MKQQMNSDKKPFTVLMLLPDYVADNYGEVCEAHVLADDVQEAEQTAALQAYQMHEHNNEPLTPAMSAELQDKIESYAIVAVYEGHHGNIKSTN